MPAEPASTGRGSHDGVLTLRGLEGVAARLEALSRGLVTVHTTVFALAGLFLAWPAVAAEPPADACADAAIALPYWRSVREAIVAGDEVPADALAVNLAVCLGSPDPELRDRIGYEVLTYWLRNDKLSDDTRRSLLEDLEQKLAPSAEGLPRAEPLARSFSALVLSELVRSDAHSGFMDAAERGSLLQSAIAALEREDDYRGLEEDVGWVHPVAHMADLLWRFAEHPKTTSAEASQILAGLRAQIAPTRVSYGFNEGDRLARVVSTLIGRNLLPEAEIAAWLAAFETPRSMENWTDAFASRAGMAELHNTKLFLRALDAQLQGTDLEPALADRLVALQRLLAELV